MGRIKEAIVYDIEYTIIALVLVGIYWFLDRKYTKRIRVIDIIAISVMVVLSAMRYYVGSDYEEYLFRYSHYINNWSSIVSRISSERVFYYVCHFFSLYSKNPYGIFWICALILYPPLVIVARKVTGAPSRLIACYVFLELYAMSNNILRQAIAAELVMFGYVAIKRGRRVLGVVLYILSVGFHLTSIIGIALVIISGFIKPTRKNLYKSLLIGLGAIVFWRPIVKSFERMPLINTYIHYLDQTGHYVVRYGMIAYICFYASIALWLIKEIRHANDDYLQLVNSEYVLTNLYNDSISLIIISIPLFFVATQVSYFYRLTLYLYPLVIFSLTDMIMIHRDKSVHSRNTRVKTMTALCIWLLISNVISLDNTYWQITFR